MTADAAGPAADALRLAALLEAASAQEWTGAEDVMALRRLLSDAAFQLRRRVPAAREVDAEAIQQLLDAFHVQHRRGEPPTLAKFLALALAGLPEQEQCSFCKEWYPKPVSLHHSQEECDANQKAPPEAAVAEALIPEAVCYVSDHYGHRKPDAMEMNMLFAWLAVVVARQRERLK